MLRLLLESNTRGFQFRPGALVSLVAHSVLITASVLATREGPAELIEDGAGEGHLPRADEPHELAAAAEESVRFLRVGEKAGTGGSEEKIVDNTATPDSASRREGKGGRQAGEKPRGASFPTPSMTRSRQRSTSTRRSPDLPTARHRHTRRSCWT